MNKCTCKRVKEYRGTYASCFQCIDCLRIFSEKKIDRDTLIIERLEHTKTPFKSFIRDCCSK